MIRSSLLRFRASANGGALVRTGALTGAGFLVSLLRDMSLAAMYGGSAALDIFFVALGPTLYWATEAANLAYLSAMPILATEHRRLPPAPMVIALMALALASAAGLSAAAWIAPSIIAPGLVKLGERHAIAIAVTALALLIPILTLGGLMRAMLELAGRFSFWALLPAFRSASICVLALATAGAGTSAWLIGGMLAGCVAWLGFGTLLERQVVRSAMPPVPTVARPPIRHLLPFLLMILIGQLGGLSDNHFASQLGVGGVQAYTLAVNLLVVPQGLIGGVVAAVYFPTFARACARGTRSEAEGALHRALRLTTYGMLPAIILFASPAGEWVTHLIYGRGKFSPELTALTASCAAALALGQLAFAVWLLQRQLLIAAKSAWPVVASIAVFAVVKIGGAALLIPALGLAGIALASSIASIVAVIVLVIPVRLTLATLPTSRPLDVTALPLGATG